MKVLTIAEKIVFDHSDNYGLCLRIRHSEDPNDVFGFTYLSDTELDIPSGLYRHFKGGKYKTVGVTFRKKTSEMLIVYEQLYDSETYPKGTLWARPINDFFGKKEIDGKEVPRFEYIGE